MEAEAFFSTTIQRRRACEGSSRSIRKYGTTGCLPTLITDRCEITERLAAVAGACLSIPGVLGFHLEGPALNRSRKGIHSEEQIRVPDGRDLASIKAFGGRGRSVVTLAPECVPASMIDEIIGSGLRVAVGHSDATAAEIGQAVDRGVSGVTHLFNAMSQMTAGSPDWWVPRLWTTGCLRGSSAMEFMLTPSVCVLPSGARDGID